MEPLQSWKGKARNKENTQVIEREIQQKKINKKEDQTELEERDEKGQWGEDPVYDVYHVTHV